MAGPAHRAESRPSTSFLGRPWEYPYRVFARRADRVALNGGLVSALTEDDPSVDRLIFRHTLGPRATTTAPEWTF